MGLDKNTLCSMKTQTVVRMNKGGRSHDNEFHERVEKISVCSYTLGNSYEDRVRSNQEKEGLVPDFVSQSPKGKKHITTCILTDTKTETKRFLMVERYEKMNPKNDYIVDGNDPIEKHLFEKWMVKSYSSNTQDQEKEVFPLTFNVDNIISITVNKIKYIQVN